MGEPCFTDCDVRFTLEMQGMPKTPLWCKILCVSVWWPVIQQSESIKLSGEECQIGVWPLANPVTDTHKVEWGKQPAAGSNVRMLQWGNCQSVVQQAGIWLYWSFLQKMLVLMTKSDSSTFSSRLFVSQIVSHNAMINFSLAVGVSRVSRWISLVMIQHCGTTVESWSNAMLADISCTKVPHHTSKDLQKPLASGLFHLCFFQEDGPSNPAWLLDFLRNEQ